MGRLYWDKHGVENVNLRIGSCFPEPTDARMLSTWLSYADLVRLVRAAVDRAAHRALRDLGVLEQPRDLSGARTTATGSAGSRRTRPRRSGRRWKARSPATRWWSATRAATTPPWTTRGTAPRRGTPSRSTEARHVLLLEGGGWTASLLPEAGGAVGCLRFRGRDVLAPLPLGADPNPSFCGAFVMAPWANRLDGGRAAGGRNRAPPAGEPAGGRHRDPRPGARPPLARCGRRRACARRAGAGVRRRRARPALALRRAARSLPGRRPAPRVALRLCNRARAALPLRPRLAPLLPAAARDAASVPRRHAVRARRALPAGRGAAHRRPGRRRGGV